MKLSTIRRICFLLLIMAVSLCPESILGITLMLRFGIAVGLFVLWIVLELPSFYISAANKAFKRGDGPKGWNFLKKSMLSGLPLSSDDVYYIASVCIQYGDDFAPAMKLLDKRTAGSNHKRNRIFYVLKAMGLSRQRKYAEASALLQETVDAGVKDEGVYLNLISALFQQHRFEDGRKLFQYINEDALFARDLIGMSLIEQQRMEDAAVLYREVADSYSRIFAECYVHMAQVELWCGRDGNANKYLKAAGQCIFVKTSAMTPAYVKRLQSDMKSAPGRSRINSNPLKVMLAENY